MSVRARKRVDPRVTVNKAYQVILNPLVTEKATQLSEFNKVVFSVPLNANKIDIKSSIEKIGGKCPDLISSNATPHNVTIENRWYQMQRVLNTPDIRGTFASDKIDMKNLSSANGSGKLPSSFSTLSSSDDNNNSDLVVHVVAPLYVHYLFDRTTYNVPCRG